MAWMAPCVRQRVLIIFHSFQKEATDNNRYMMYFMGLPLSHYALHCLGLYYLRPHTIPRPAQYVK